MYRLLFVIGLLFSGCISAKMVKAPRSSSRYGPIEGGNEGVISYSANGADSIIESRREYAYKKMYEACNGRYKIISESQQMDGGMLAPIGGTYYISSTKTIYIKFKCI